MNRRDSVFCHGSILMVINDLHVISIALAPFKTNAPLVVDANTVLALTVARQFFEVVGWWYPQILQRVCAIKEFKLPPCTTLDGLRQLARELAPKQFCGFFVRKTLDHGADDNASRYDCRALLCIGNVNTLCVERHLGSKPNAGSEPRLEAEAQRTLEGVGSSALFGSDSARGSAHGRAPFFIAPRAIDSASRVHGDLHSADNLVCLEQDHGRQREPEGLRGLEIDDEFDLHGLLHWEFGGCGPSQDFVDVDGNLLCPPPIAGGIAQRYPASTAVRDVAHRGQPPLNREGSNLALKGAQGRVPEHEECLDLRVRHRCKGAVERGGLAHLEAVQRHRQRLGCLFQRFPGARKVRHSVEHRDAGDPRQRLLQPFQLFRERSRGSWRRCP